MRYAFAMNGVLKTALRWGGFFAAGNVEAVLAQIKQVAVSTFVSDQGGSYVDLMDRAINRADPIKGAVRLMTKFQDDCVDVPVHNDANVTLFTFTACRDGTVTIRDISDAGATYFNGTRDGFIIPANQTADALRPLFSPNMDVAGVIARSVNEWTRRKQQERSLPEKITGS